MIVRLKSASRKPLTSSVSNQMLNVKDVASVSWDSLLNFWRNGNNNNNNNNNNFNPMYSTYSNILTSLYEYDDIMNNNMNSKAKSIINNKMNLVALEAKLRSKICNYNSQVITKYITKNPSVATRMSHIVRIWELLGVSFDIMAMSSTSNSTSSIKNVSSYKNINMISWKNNVLGLNLIATLFNDMFSNNDNSNNLIIMAEIICVFGGSRAFYDILNNNTSCTNTHNSSYSLLQLDSILLSYISLLRKWNKKIIATEVN